MNRTDIDNLIYNNQIGINTMLPAKVISFDKQNNEVDLKITIGNDKYPDLLSIPVHKFFTGFCAILYDLKPDTEGYVLFFQRDISNGENQDLASLRMHSFSDGFFVPAFSHKQQEQPSNTIELNEDSINIKTGETQFNMKSNEIQITGDVKIQGKITADDVVTGGKSLKNHKHSAGTYTGQVPIKGTSGENIWLEEITLTQVS